MAPRGVVGLLACAAAALAQAEPALQIGSKRFTESYVVAEILAQRTGGTHKPGLGNTAILFGALANGAIDLYPEYTGTIAREILKTEERLDLAMLNERLAPLGLQAGYPLGFANSYALGMKRELAGRLGVSRISDLARSTGLRYGLSHEFLGRRDGWPGLARAYGLAGQVRGLDHGLAYEALAAGQVDVVDLYSTDAKIERYEIAVLADDRAFFPAYEAVLLHRAEAPARFPAAFAALRGMQGRIDTPTMVRLNARAELDRQPFEQVAREFLGAQASASERSLAAAVFAPDFTRLLAQHIGLVAGSLLAAVAVGVPLGLVAANIRVLAQPVMIATGLVQTIPSLALLAFLIPLTGMIGVWPALLALFLYALLPIARNTHAGLAQVPGGLRQAAIALGMRRAQVLRRVELPLAAPMILAGIKTSAIVNVGTATIAAFIGAGGFGERISQGLALNDNVVLLAGALPAAALALLVHALFELAELALVRRHRGGAPR